MLRSPALFVPRVELLHARHVVTLTPWRRDEVVLRWVGGEHRLTLTPLEAAEVLHACARAQPGVVLGDEGAALGDEALEAAVAARSGGPTRLVPPALPPAPGRRLGPALVLAAVCAVAACGAVCCGVTGLLATGLSLG
ncbi:MAG: hypothetical protein R3F59_09485 [Myxococcota bacterium]